MQEMKSIMSVAFNTVEEFAPYREDFSSLLAAMCGRRNGMLFFVALNEAVNNALFHGNRECPDGCVEVAITDEGENVCISVRSDGSGFEHDLRADPEVFSDSSKESGRGVQIILHVMDEVSIEEAGSTVTLRMRKEKQADESSASSPAVREE